MLFYLKVHLIEIALFLSFKELLDNSFLLFPKRIVVEY